MHRSAFTAALLLALLGPAAAHPGHDTRPPAPRLIGADCLQPGLARGFTNLDDRRLLVDAGRRRYLVEVYGSCWNLEHSTLIAFRGDPISNRVCGSLMDAVLVAGGHPCKISRVEMVDKEAYKALLQQREDWKQARRAERAARKQR